TAGSTTAPSTWGAGTPARLLSDGAWSFVYGPEGPIAQIGASGTQWFFHDQIGSTRALVNGSGTIVARYGYTEYGVASRTGTASTPMQYTGQYTDAETGFVYLRARYYDPATALFLTVDPKVNDTGTPYIYVGGDPLNDVDPSGLCSFWCWVGTGAAVVAVGACVVLEPCGIAAGGGMALAGGGMLAGGLTVTGGSFIAGGAIAGGIAGAAAYAAANSSSGGSKPTQMIGQNGTRTTSTTTYNKGPYRIDVENPNPGGRPGQMHFQDQSGRIPKCQYDFETGDFEGIPPKVLKELAKDPAFQRGVQKGLNILGE
ncbi:MAG TPA: RHS repeat-associated core domain-containing protein, partial [Umezawaea sp.]|nr:RHS repeat-associated core domain-containing protein [Umezawaea sp.]